MLAMPQSSSETLTSNKPPKRMANVEVSLAQAIGLERWRDRPARIEHLGPSAARPEEREGTLCVRVTTNGVQKIASFGNTALQQGLTPRTRANSGAEQLEIAVRHPCKTLKVMRGEILNGRASRNDLSLFAGNGETNFEKALHKGGKGLLNRGRATSNNPIIEEEGVVVKITWEARFRCKSSRSDPRVECQSEKRRAERVALLNASLTTDQ